MAYAKAKLIIFDIDGTLAERDTDVLLPGVRAFFERQANNFMFALATNQGGVGLRYWMAHDGFGNPDKYPDEVMALNHIWEVMDKLTEQGRHDDRLRYYVCFAYQSQKSGKWSPTPPGREDDIRWSSDYRKPAPGMLNLAMQHANVTPVQTLMVGDFLSDKQAAEAAGCHFQQAHEFFGREAPAEKG